MWPGSPKVCSPSTGFALYKPKTTADMDKEMQELMENEDYKEEMERYQKRQKGELEEMGTLE